MKPFWAPLPLQLRYADASVAPVPHPGISSTMPCEQRARILFVTNQYPTSTHPGAGPCIELQKQSLMHLGFVVDVLFFDGPASRWNYLRAMARLFWIVQIRKRYDLVHAHYGLSGIVARAQFRCPVVVTFRGSDVLAARERPISRLVARNVDRSIVMTEEMRQLLGQEDAKVIPYGIDLEMFKPVPQSIARQELGMASKPPVVLFPYDPRRPEKRFDLVERAVALLRSKFPDIELLAVFGKKHEEIVDYMNACDVMALTSDTEGAPVAIREAMACNLPIVSVDVGDAAKVIRNVSGCYVCSRAPEDIAAKLASVLNERKRTNGRLAALEFDLSRSAADLAAIYQELLSATKARQPAQARRLP